MAETEECRTRVLIIGYGNPLRRDDGLGPFIVQSLAANGRAGMQTLTALQLLPELAASLAQADVAIFVDCRAGGEEVELTLLEERDAWEWSSHRADPRDLLALTRAVYGRSPRSWWVTVPGVDFSPGEGLSWLARGNARTARECIEELLSSYELVGWGERSTPPLRSGASRGKGRRKVFRTAVLQPSRRGKLPDGGPESGAGGGERRSG